MVSGLLVIIKDLTYLSHGNMQEHHTPFRKLEKLFHRPPPPTKGSERRRTFFLEKQYNNLDQIIKEHAIDFELISPLWQKDGISAYGIDGADGFYLIRGILSPMEQRNILSECFLDYIGPPNVTNLDTETGNSPYKPSDPTQNKRGLYNDALKDEQAAIALGKLRWCTLGLPYDWTTRTYDSNSGTKLPGTLLKLCERIAVISGAPMVPEGGLVNYYRSGDTLCGHVDDAEKCLDSPLYSISLGSDAVFLLGRETRDVIPNVILLKSGDVVVLSQKSRRYYHGIPRILEHRLPAHLTDETWPFAKHMQAIHSRLNISIRQVYPHN